MAISPQRQKELDAMVARQKASRAAAQQQEEPKKGFLSGVAESLTKRGEEIAQTASDVWNQKINPIEGSLQFVGKGIGAVTDVIGQAGIAAVKAVTPDSVEKAVMESAPVKAGLEIAQQGMEAYEAWKQKNPRVAKDLESVVNIASLFPVGGAAKAGAGALTKGTKAVTRAITDTRKGIVRGVEKSAIGTAVKTGTKAASELATEAGSALARGTKKLAAAAEEKAAQGALPTTVRNLHRVGLPDETISRITTASPETTGFLKKMATKVEERMGNPRSSSRALDVPGEVLTKTASKLSSSVKSVGRQLGAVKRALRGKAVDLIETQNSILQDINDLRLKVRNGKIVAPLGVPADPDVLSILNDIYKYVGSGSDAEIVDLLRTTLSKSYNKLGTPFSDNATRLMTKYKDLALKAISETDPQYGALAAQYSEQINALKEFTKLIGYKGSMEDIGEQALKAGEVTRRMLGQASARPTEIINELLAQAKKAGIDFGGNFDDLVRFADELDDIAGLTQTTGLQGAVQRAGEAVVGESGGIISKVGSGLMRLGASGAEEKIKAIKEFFEDIGRPKALAPGNGAKNSLTIEQSRAFAKAIPETININTPERIAIRNEIAEKLYGTGAKNKNRRMDIVIGPPAAGKSVVIAEPLSEKFGSLILDADRAKELLPEFNDGIGANALHKESAEIIEGSVFNKAVRNGDNIVFPMVGKTLEKMEDFIRRLKALGYDVHLHLNDLPPEEAAKRAEKRFYDSGRFVDPEYILHEVGKKPLNNFQILKKMPELSSFEHLSNDVPLGTPPRKIE